MAVRTILIYPDPILATQSEPIDEITEEVKTLAHDMLETMVAARGIGLAANQVGVTKRLIVVDLNPFPGEEEEGEVRDPALGPHVMINPEIVAREGSIVWEEGCLSVPERSAVIQADFTNLEGQRMTLEASELMAVCIQHEIDHLDGIVYPDRMHDRARARAIRLAMKALKSA